MRFLIQCAFGGAVLASPALGEGPDERVLPVRMWLIHHYDLPYINRVIDLAPAEGINYIQLSHDIVHDIEDFLNDPQRQKDFPGIVDRAHKNGVKVVMWTHELNAVPGRFETEGKVDLRKPELWEWLRGKYERVFGELLPEVDGLILTFHETDVSVYHDNKVISDEAHPTRVTRLINEIYSVCKEYDKELYVRTFVYRPDELDWVIEGIGGTDSGVRVMSKCVPHDWQPRYPHNPAIGKFPDRTHIVEMDLCGEYYGQAIVPYCFPDYVKYRLDHARSKGLQGAVARIDRHANHTLDTPNWVNVLAYDRLLQDPTVTVEQIWDEFCTGEYGKSAAEVAQKALARTKDIIENMYLIREFYFLNSHSRVPSVRYTDGHITSHSVAKWDPAYKQTEEHLLHPNEAVYREIMREKEEAIELTRRSLEVLRAGKFAFEPEKYAELRERFEKLMRCARLWKELTDAYFRWRMFDQNPGEKERVRLELALSGLEAEAAWLEKAVGSDVAWESANKAREFGKELRKRMKEK
jgi:hypothetical protein